MKLQKRTILITGGTSGIGLELAKELVRRDNVVIVTGRDLDRLETAQRLVPDLRVFQSDVSDAAAVARLCQDVVAQFPALDTLINNAGIMRNLDLQAKQGVMDVTREMEVNFNGPVRTIQGLLAHLQSRPGGLIVNVTSGLAFVPYPASPIYCAAKAALHSFTESLRVQLAGTGVRVVELAPPAVETPLFRGEFAEEMKGEKGMGPVLFVKKALAGIEAGHLEIRPGLSNVLKLMSRVAPGFGLKQMVKLMKPNVRSAAA